jgi:hypothetical protein
MCSVFKNEDFFYYFLFPETVSYIRIYCSMKAPSQGPITDQYSRVVDPDWFLTDPDPDPAFLLNPDPVPDPGPS